MMSAARHHDVDDPPLAQAEDILQQGRLSFGEKPLSPVPRLEDVR